MYNFDNDKTKELEKLFNKKDIIGLETFMEKNSLYKKVYAPFKGRFYFNAKDRFSFKISPDQKTAVLACMLYEKHAYFQDGGYNLEILVAQADAYGNFHKCEHIRFDNADKINFVGLDNNAILLQNTNSSQQLSKYNLRGKPIVPSGISASGIRSANSQKEALLKARAEYRSNKQKYPPNALQAKLSVWNEINSKIKL